MSIIISYTVPRCRNGKTFQTCARCFRTCKNPHRLTCTRRCRRGCFCPSGRVSHRGRCILPRQCRGSEWNLTCIVIKLQYMYTIIPSQTSSQCYFYVLTLRQYCTSSLPQQLQQLGLAYQFSVQLQLPSSREAYHPTWLEQLLIYQLGWCGEPLEGFTPILHQQRITNPSTNYFSYDIQQNKPLLHSVRVIWLDISLSDFIFHSLFALEK